MQCYCPLLINCSSRISKNRADQLGPICINLLSWIAICVSKTALAQIQTSFDHRLTACPGILLTEGQRLSCRKMLSKDIKRVYTGARQFSYVQSMYWDMAQTMARISCTQVEINMTWQPWQRCFANGVVGDPLSIAWILSDPHWGVGAGMGRVVLMFVVSQVVVIAHKMMLNHDWYHERTWAFFCGRMHLCVETWRCASQKLKPSRTCRTCNKSAHFLLLLGCLALLQNMAAFWPCLTTLSSISQHCSEWRN